MRSPTLFHFHASMSLTEVKGTLIPPPGKAIKIKRAGIGGICCWACPGRQRRTHAIAGASRYDQPVFVHDRFHLRHVGRPARVHDSRNVFEISFPRDRRDKLLILGE